MATYEDDDFRYCEECKCEHNYKGETREEYEARMKNPHDNGATETKLQALRRTISQAKQALENAPDTDESYNVDTLQAASMTPLSASTKTAQIALTQAVTELCASQGYRMSNGAVIKPSLGEHVAALARVAVDALVSSRDGHERSDSIKAMLNALVDEAVAFYAEHKPKMDEAFKQRRESLQHTITSMEMMTGLLETEQKRQMEADIKSGAAENRLAAQATIVANTSTDDAAKQREFETLLKALDGKNTRVH